MFCCETHAAVNPLSKGLKVSSLHGIYLQEEADRINLEGTSSFEPIANQSTYFIALRNVLQFFNLSNNFRLAFDYWQWLYITDCIIYIIAS
jgi:hypothetical protein